MSGKNSYQDTTAICPVSSKRSILTFHALIPKPDVNFGFVSVFTVPPIWQKLMISWGLMKQGIGRKCNTCNKLVVECPHCNSLEKIQTVDYVDQVCKNCSKRFYIAV